MSTLKAPAVQDARTQVHTDILVVGAGPTGLYAAVYAGLRGLRVAVVDSLPELGGQVSAMYPEKQIFDVAGFPGVRGRDLVAGLIEQAGAYDPTYLLGHQAEGLSYLLDGKPVVHTDQGADISCGAVVITGGIGTFRPRPLPCGRDYEQRGLVYFVPRLADLAGLDVVVVGGGDSALDWSLSLHPIARSVTLVHRRDAFRGHRSTLAKVRESPVEVLTPHELTVISGPDRVEAVEITHAKTKEVLRRPAQAVVAALGFTADLGPLTSWGLSVTGRQIPVDTRMGTSLPRVYAAGDITDYPGKVRLIAVGFGEAATAVNNAAVALDPEAELFPGHSTERDS